VIGMTKIEIAEADGSNAIEIDRCKDIDEVSVTRFAKKPIRNKDSPTVDDDAYVGDPMKYVITGFVTDTHRRNLEARKEAHNEVRILEDSVKVDDGFIIKLKARWRGGENTNYPWFVTVTIISYEKI